MPPTSPAVPKGLLGACPSRLQTEGGVALGRPVSAAHQDALSSRNGNFRTAPNSRSRARGWGPAADTATVFDGDRSVYSRLVRGNAPLAQGGAMQQPVLISLMCA